MAQSTNDILALEEAYWEVMSKIVGVEKFLQQDMTVGNPRLEQWVEAGELRRKLTHRLSLLKILWHSECQVSRYERLDHPHRG